MASKSTKSVALGSDSAPRGVQFRADDGGSTIDLSGLTSFLAASKSDSSLLEQLGSGRILASNLASVTGVTVRAAGGSKLTLPALTSYAHGTIGAIGLDAGGDTALIADGPGSQLDLPALTTITGPTPGNSRLIIQSLAGGRVDLRAVTQITVPSGSDAAPRGVQVTATGAGSIVDLSGLTDFIATGKQNSSLIEPSNGAQILADQLARTTGVSLRVSNGQVLALPSLVTFSRGGYTLRPTLDRL